MYLPTFKKCYIKNVVLDFLRVLHFIRKDICGKNFLEPKISNFYQESFF